jgi:hypothetical protein
MVAFSKGNAGAIHNTPTWKCVTTGSKTTECSERKTIMIMPSYQWMGRQTYVNTIIRLSRLFMMMRSVTLLSDHYAGKLNIFYG